MRYIKKSSIEPTELLKYRKTCQPNCTWDDFDTNGKKAVRKKLVDEQGQICCYCMQRIDTSSVKVEHYLSRSNHPNKQLEWKNLLAACSGGKGQSKDQQTCDTRKGSNAIEVDPLDKRHINDVRYDPEGRVLHDRFQNDLDNVLNLNLAILKQNRKSVLKGFREVLQGEFGGKKWSTEKLEKQLFDLQSASQAGPFQGVLEYWIAKQIRKRA